MNTQRNLESPNSPATGELQVVWTIWLTYGAFYFCRQNLAVALPGIEADLGFDKAQMGIVLSALKIAYGCGQFVNGQLAERFSARKMLVIGMLASAGLNVVFGFGTALYFFLFVWAINGYAQSLGWTPCVRVLGNWIPVSRRGKAIGIVGTGYQVTAGLTYVVAGVSVWLLGWRGALWLPPIILIACSLVMWFALREYPTDADESTTPRDAIPAPEKRGFLENLRATVSNPALWLLAGALAMLNACRYGFIDWGVSHLVAIERAEEQRQSIHEVLDSGKHSGVKRRRLLELLELDLVQDEAQDQVKAAIADDLLPEKTKASRRMSVLKSAIKYAVLPIGAVLGAFLAGWATDRFFGSRRAPVICGLLVVLGGTTLIYDSVARSSFVGTMGVLVVIGFCIYGPQVLLVGTAPADLAREGTSAAAAGFVNCFGYFGAAAAGDWLTGYLAKHHGWNAAIYAWAGWAFGAAILSAILWNATAKRTDESTNSESE